MDNSTKEGFRMKLRRILAGVTASLSIALAMPMAAMAATTVVTPTNTDGWSTAATTSGGTVNFIYDPTSPLPDGALQLTTDATTTSKAQYMHAASTPLANVTEMSYSTKQVSGPSIAAPAYQLIVCLNGAASATTCNPNLNTTPPAPASSFSTLVFEPYQNTALGTITPGAWQSWDVDQGLFWSTRTVTCSGGTVNGSSGGPAIYTLAQLQALCPSAVVTGYGANIGSNNPSYNVEVDRFVFNDTTYDFEDATVKVTIDKYVDNVKATPTNANNAAFPMEASWTSTNVGSGTGVAYTISSTGYNSPTPYQAVTSNMSLGSSYSTNEVTSGNNVVATSCTQGGAPFALIGYSSGNTLAEALAGTKTTTAPRFDNLQTDKYVIVWNDNCATPNNPTNPDQCKKNGWQTFLGIFKNQGDCVSFITRIRNSNRIRVNSSNNQTATSGNVTSNSNTSVGNVSSGNARNNSSSTITVTSSNSTTF